LLFAALAFWLAGSMLYVWLIATLFHRMLFRPLSPGDLTPPYWIAMGATAITAVAGGRITEMTAAPAGDVTRNLIAAASVVVLAFGTWLIPPLLAVGWWRHVTHRIAPRYDTSWWSIVFPLGMYSVAGHDLGTADHLPLLAAIGDAAGWPALAAWLITFVAMLADLIRQHARASGRNTSPP
jgi:tellurite resistance protein TehA-like permease